MDFRLLGPLEAVRDGRRLPLGGVRQKSLLALLLLHPNDVVSRDRLVDELWSNRPTGAASHSLDVQVSRLRRSFEPDDPIATRGGGYVLEVDPEQIDACRFERLLEEGRKWNAEGEPSRALAAVQAGLALWRGSALADLAYERFARAEVDRLEELRLVALEERIDAELAIGRDATAVPELEALIAEHPYRERLRAQLMLALYRSGRQADALRAYSETRSRLVEELGIEPRQSLRELEQLILRQDPGLDRPSASRRARRRRGLASALALVAAGVVAAVVVLVTRGGTESANALAAAHSTALVAAGTGEIVGDAPVRDTVGVRFGMGSLWSVSSKGELTRIDRSGGEVIDTAGLAILKPGGIAVGEGSVWVTDAYTPTVLRVDPTVGEVVDRFPLPTRGVVTDLTGGIAVGAGSVWVGHGAFNPGAWLERLDPRTGRVEHRFPIRGGDANAVAYGDGAVWVGSRGAGELRRIDPETNAVVFAKPLRPNAHVRAVAAGGGFGWAAIDADSSVWKVGRDGRLVDTIDLPAPARSLTYAAGAVWAALGERGAVVRIDPTTDAKRVYEVGHAVTDVDADSGLVAVGVQPSAQDVTADLEGDVVRVGLASHTVFEIGDPTLPSTDPALYAPWDKNLAQFDHATCARLYDYPDVEGAAGRYVVPDVAAGFPTVSDGGRTAEIEVREGFRFSPPSNEPVTAASFREAIERVLSPKFAGDYLDPRWKVIVGAESYNAGRSAHVAGVGVDENTLVIRLKQPVPDLARLLALNVFCPVPVGTPVVSHGLESAIPSAGPYYLAAVTDSAAVLKRNPGYGGSRPRRLDAIVLELGIAPQDAAARVANGTLDYVFEHDPTLEPGSAAARAAGARYRLTPDTGGHVFALAFNTERPLFARFRMRRAVQLALDRAALARADPNAALPTTRLLSPKVAGSTDAALYPLRGDVGAARRLAASRRARAVVYTWKDSYTSAFNRVLTNQLAAIGIEVTIRTMTNDDFANGTVGAKASRSDLVWSGFNAETSDPVAYLQQLFLPPADRTALERIAGLPAPERDRRAAALARKVERESLVVPYDVGAIPELVSSRLGCMVHQPELAGIDLAALCLRHT